MKTISIIAQAAEIAAAAWEAEPYETPFLVVPCRECQGIGTQRYHRGRGMFDYDDLPCRHCKGDGEVAIPNPKFRG